MRIQCNRLECSECVYAKVLLLFRGNLDDYPKAGCGFDRVVLSHSKVIVLISRNMDSLYVCVWSQWRAGQTTAVQHRAPLGTTWTTNILIVRHNRCFVQHSHNPDSSRRTRQRFFWHLSSSLHSDRYLRHVSWWWPIGGHNGRISSHSYL